jgi:CBS domain-containing protein
VRPVLIAVSLVLAQDPPQMGLIPDEGPVEKLAPASADPAFSDGVHPRRPDVAEHGPDPGTGENGPIADPDPDLVDQIERLRELYLTPPTALSTLGRREVCSVRPDQPVSAALEYVRLFDYSQLPVYDGGGYVGILTTNTVARWLAAQLAETEGLAEAESIGHVLASAEQHERARHVPRTITAANAIHQLSRGGHAGKPLTALIITNSAKTTEKPLAVAVDDDLPALVAALTAG